MTKRALHRMARASVICAAIESTPARLRRSSSRVGMGFMKASSTGLQLRGWIDTHRAPCGIQGREQCRDHRQGDLYRGFRGAEAHELEYVGGENPARSRESKIRHELPRGASRRTDHRGLGEILNQ